MKRQSMDGCTAAAYIAYAFSDVATVYPITPIASMGETAQKWNLAGINNLYGYPMEVREMESELGAAGATHGALAAGCTATTFTASQGLMLMIPNMYKISGELLPAVFHVGCRALATHALSIFGDHQDVMACRATGFAMLSSTSVQEAHDMAIVAHIAALRSSIPVLHFFDGWRTSNETDTIEIVSYDELRPLLPAEDVEAFRSRGFNPRRPVLRGTAQNPDVYFQNREAANRFYDAFPSIVKGAMERVSELTGRQYSTVEYHGAEDAVDVIVSMGSSCRVVNDTVDMLNSRGGRVGAVNMRLYRPFPSEDFIAALPPTVRRIAVLDRTKEPGSAGEPLYLDVSEAVASARREISVIGGRYGLGSKEFYPRMVVAVFDNLTSDKPVHGFTVGIDDDVTHRSLPLGQAPQMPRRETLSAMFYGMGSDGTVGATKACAGILAETAGLYSQAYFKYSAKKSGGYTISELRLGTTPDLPAYSIENADYVACNKDVYARKYPLADNLAPGGIFVLNTPLDAAAIDKYLPAALKRRLAAKKARFYIINAPAIAARHGLGVRVNMIMLAAFFHLRPVADYDKVMAALSDKIKVLYAKRGPEVIAANIAALADVPAVIAEVQIPATWADATDAPAKPDGAPKFVTEVARVCDSLRGDILPVSAFTPDGSMPMGTTAWEKRSIAEFVPCWKPDNCVRCTECSLVCSHAAIRPFVADTDELDGAPEGFATVPAPGKTLAGKRFRIQVYPRDCTGCASCATVCPGHALDMMPAAAEIATQEPMLEFALEHISSKAGLLPRTSIPGSQLYPPLMQFSGACGGCGETPYVKLLTQLMGERMIVANATGCSSVWGADYPSNAYCTNSDGHGPAWGNSLFEDNAEYAYGMAVAVASRRRKLASLAQAAVSDPSTTAEVRTALQEWLAVRDDSEASVPAADAVIAALKSNPGTKGAARMLQSDGLLAKPSVWAIGGDGWAFDIGFGGLDHVLARDIDINVLVLDTQCYSNTGGQMSKATPLGAVAGYAADGKQTPAKQLGRMMMVYPDVYVASVALGADFAQTVRALVEADRHNGPSIVLAYCPCINHGIRAGMGWSVIEERKAVATGLWTLYRRNPGTSPTLEVDSKAPSQPLDSFLDGEDRYAALAERDPERAKMLREALENACSARNDELDYDALYGAPHSAASDKQA